MPAMRTRPRICLASASPRRREILESLGFALELRAADLDESVLDELPVAERVIGLARLKALAAAPQASERFVLAADTLVHLPLDSGEDRVLGKAADRGEAAAMLRLLAGKEHLVHTGMALLDRATGRVETIRSESRVRFSPISEAELEAYLESGEWEGVAGAYRIQGLAACFITDIAGSWSGIVGLPIRELYVILRAAQAPFPIFREEALA